MSISQTRLYALTEKYLLSFDTRKTYTIDTDYMLQTFIDNDISFNFLFQFNSLFKYRGNRPMYIYIYKAYTNN